MNNSPQQDRSYTIGFGKPPEHTRFPKGISGNPKGRPKGSKGVGTIVAEMSRKKIQVSHNGRKQWMTMLEAMVMQLITRAAGGDLKAIREVLAAHRLYVEPAEVLETSGESRERDTTVMKNLLRRMRKRSDSEMPLEDQE